MPLANVAALDCGSLSTRLLVAAPQGKAIARLMRVTGLARGVDRTGSLAQAAVERVLAVLEEYRAVMDAHAVGAVAMVGTSALRDAGNRASFMRRAAQVVGAELQLLEGEEEARLSFRGATAELAPGQGPFLVVDIGGGSTELAVGPSPFAARSLDVGCVRLTERYLHRGTAPAVGLDEARRWLRELLEEATTGLPALGGARTMVALAGTVSALACFDQGLVSYERDRVHHYRLSHGAVRRALAELAALPEESRAARPGVEPARAPYIVGGSLVLDEVMGHFGFNECLVSEADILDGLVARLVEQATDRSAAQRSSDGLAG